MYVQMYTKSHDHMSVLYVLQCTVEPLNNGHSGDRPLVHCREVVPISEVTECMLQSVGGKQSVSSTSVARFSECPLSEVTLYTTRAQFLTHQFGAW